MARYFKSFRCWGLAVSCWLLAIGTLSSCQEGGEAGDLLGQWRLSDTEANYMNISGSVVWLRNNSDGVFGNFQHVGDSLFIQCYSSSEQRSDTLLVEEDFGFMPFNNIRLNIESVDGDRLVLSKGTEHWNFYKY